eukprot:scaffold250023_cov62-Attheya_sp.AAC.2
MLRAAELHTSEDLAARLTEIVDNVDIIQEAKEELESLSGEKEEEKDYSKAVKAGDAEADYAMWVEPGEDAVTAKARNLLRQRCWSWWIPRLTLEACRWLSLKGRPEDTELVRDAVQRCSNSSWFEWNDGSSLLFWHWPREFQSDARDGTWFFHDEPPMHWMGRSYPSTTREIEEQLRSKEDKIIFRRYSEAGCFVLSVTPRFGVKKEKFDVRLVWDSFLEMESIDVFGCQGSCSQLHRRYIDC